MKDDEENDTPATSLETADIETGNDANTPTSPRSTRSKSPDSKEEGLLSTDDGSATRGDPMMESVDDLADQQDAGCW